MAPEQKILEQDWSQWGDWEVWEHHVIAPTTSGALGKMPSGDWCAWDSVSGEYRAFGSRPGVDARRAAEMLAVMMNGGKPTRIVEACIVRESCMTFEHVTATVTAEKQRMHNAAPDVWPAP